MSRVGRYRELTHSKQRGPRNVVRLLSFTKEDGRFRCEMLGLLFPTRRIFFPLRHCLALSSGNDNDGFDGMNLKSAISWKHVERETVSFPSPRKYVYTKSTADGFPFHRVLLVVVSTEFSASGLKSENEISTVSTGVNLQHGWSIKLREMARTHAGEGHALWIR